MFTDCATGMNFNLRVALKEEILHVAVNIDTTTKYYILSKENIRQTFK
jgi:hypothetical protein